MNVLEKILEEISEVEKEYVTGHKVLYALGATGMAIEISRIIHSHMDEAKDINVPSNVGWIPVEERLPDKGTYVMCCFDDGTVDVLWQNWKEDKSLLFYADIDGEIRKAIAWQELPEPYKPKKDNSATEHIMSRFMKVE